MHSKDAFLYLRGKITADGATYLSMKFLGNAVDEMSVESRLVMCNMAIEAGKRHKTGRISCKQERALAGDLRRSNRHAC